MALRVRWSRLAAFVRWDQVGQIIFFQEENLCIQRIFEGAAIQPPI